jgi:hypothetical protein
MAHWSTCMLEGWLYTYTWTKCHIEWYVGFWAGFNYGDKMSQKGHRICFGQQITNAGWMNSSSIFVWRGTIRAVLGWTNCLSTFMFMWNAMLQWTCVHGSRNKVDFWCESECHEDKAYMDDSSQHQVI